MDLDAIEAAEKAMTPGPLTQKHCRVSDRFDNTLAYTNNRANAEGIVILRNAAPAMIARIREQDAEIERLERQLELECGERREKDIAAACDHLHETIHRLRRFVTDQGTTCYSCEVCGHARTTRECLRCEVKELRALCGKAADRIRSFVVADEMDHPEKLPDEAAVELSCRLRWASKGMEQ